MSGLPKALLIPHTFAYEGPMFRRPVPIRSGDIVTRDGFVFADLM